jgi:SAM-dependent methyltransferase
MTTPRKPEWFDDETFWRDLYPFMFPEERFAAACEEVPRLLKLARPRGKAVLDLCCGPGRFAVPLAAHGYQVTGIDRTKWLLDKARSRARRAKVALEWVRADMRDFVRPGAFDLALSMFTSFGYFDDKREDLRVLENIHASLRRGGVLVMDMMGKERLARIWMPASTQRMPDGTVLVEQREVFDDWTRIRNEWTLIRKGAAKTFHLHHTVYSGQELRDRLEAAGFAKVKLYGNLDGDPYGLDAHRLLAVARKA